MLTYKNSKYDLKTGYRKRFELATIFTLVLTIFALYASRFAVYSSSVTAEAKEIIIDVEEIPLTEQVHRTPPPARPVVPVPSEAEDIPDDVTIASTELDLSELPPPPPPPQAEEDLEEAFVFVPYDEPPVMIGGIGALAKLITYPELARKAGIEATVMVGALIDVNGTVKKAIVFKESGTSLGFEQAATDAVMKTKWKPARQRDRKVKVWMSIPVRFKLFQAQQPAA